MASPPGTTRRRLLQMAAVGMAQLAMAPAGAMAGPFESQEPELVPADKKLDPKWVAGLFARGAPDVLSGDDLNFIGMPVGGLFAGCVYLSGEGQLWLWDVFNNHHVGCVSRPPVEYAGATLHEPDGANYVDPPKPASPFAIEFLLNGQRLGRERFGDVEFRGEYPVGTVLYRGNGLEVRLEAFSPFVPLDVEASSHPATVMRYTVTNRSDDPAPVELACRFEHPGLVHSPDALSVARLIVEPRETGGWNGAFAHLQCSPEIGKRQDAGTFAVIAPGATVSTGSEGRPKTIAAVKRTLAPGRSTTVSFIVAWHFPNIAIDGLPDHGRWYGVKWPDAWAVAAELAGNLKRLTDLTLKWRDTWYDSTLPYWLLDRTFANTSTLATTTCLRLSDGRYWFWEGTGCCAGTCTHVWSYAQAIGRVFPDVERALREQVDFGLAFHEDSGAIDYRAEFGRNVAHDGQCGCILRAYREHLMSRDTGYLSRVYPKVKKALQFLMVEDTKHEGLLEGRQYNTLDASWYGPMGWISSMYVAALRAGEAMAQEFGDPPFAQQCGELAASGSAQMVARLFDGEYFIQLTDPDHPEANATGPGCHIDQLYGQSWAHQVGLPRVVPKEQAVSAMKALYKYNFAPNVGTYRSGMKVIGGGRWYALPGEAGLIMTTFPKGGADRARGKGSEAWAAGYFNECMSGFEHQAASHMVAEGLVLEGLAVERAIHDRYAPHKRNPYNEVECSDHYGRAMASYAVYVSVTGFHCHGPSGRITFDPKLPDREQRFAFIAPDGWGTATVIREADGTVRSRLRYRHRA